MAGFKGRFTEKGLHFDEYNKNQLMKYAKKNVGHLFELTPVLPESEEQRGFLEGAVIRLATFYQEGLDHKSSKDNIMVREWLKMEFNSDMAVVNGKVHRISKSTKGRKSLNHFTEQVVGWLIENYAPPHEALNPQKYEYWRDAIQPYGGPVDYIDYLVGINILKK